jgi:hypothetical protein
MNIKDRLKEREQHKFLTFFCLDEVEDLNSPIPFTTNTIEYNYNTFWSDNHHPGVDKVITAKVKEGTTWLELWKTIDKLAKKSKDYHHIWIEQIFLSKTKPNTLEVFMGS